MEKRKKLSFGERLLRVWVNSGERIRGIEKYALRKLRYSTRTNNLLCFIEK